MSLPSIGILGAGLMGAGIASRFLAAGYPVTVAAHRSRARIDALLAQGATEAAEPGAVLTGADVLLTCLPNAEVVEALADHLCPRVRHGQIWIDVTSSRPDTSAALARRLAERGAVFADAPVTGGPPQAAAGTLASLVGCEEDDFAAIQPLVGTYSTTVRRLGGPGTGHAAKLLNNLVTQGTTILLADAFQCAGQMGIDTDALYEVMAAGAGRSGSLEKSVAPALKGDFHGARFTIANAAKDLRYAAALLEGTAPGRAPVAAALAARLDTLVAAGQGAAFVSTQLDPDRSGLVGD